jgi:hypothetical protein
MLATRSWETSKHDPHRRTAAFTGRPGAGGYNGSAATNRPQRTLRWNALLCKVWRFHQAVEPQRKTVRPSSRCGRFLPHVLSFQFIASRDRLHVDLAISRYIGYSNFAVLRGPEPSRYQTEENPARSGSRAQHFHAHLVSSAPLSRAPLIGAHRLSSATIFERTLCRVS